LDAAVGVSLIEGVMQLGFEIARERVHPLRPVERDGRDLLLDAVDQVLVAHTVLLLVPLFLCADYSAAFSATSPAVAPSTAISTAMTPWPVGLMMMGLRSSERNCPAWVTAKSPSRTSRVANASISPGGRPRAPCSSGIALMRWIARNASSYVSGAISVVVSLKISMKIPPRPKQMAGPYTGSLMMPA